ncbi:MAG: BlaI family penicillinase repressor [Pirellulaceae bacterium]|jgi:BlaI family penicillinase repressor
MAKRKTRSKIEVTRGETLLLRMLWEHGPVSLSQAHLAMQQMGQKIGYTTVQTRLERLVGKGLAVKSNSRPATFQAAIEPAEISGSVIDGLLERVAGAVPLFAQLIQDPLLSLDDVSEMKKILADAESRLARETQLSQEAKKESGK